LGSVEALQHPEGAADLDLFCQQLLGRARGFGGGCEVESCGEVLGERLEGPAPPFDPPPSGGQQVVDGDAVDPGPQGAVAAETVEPGDHLDEDLLGGVLGVVGIPQHPDRQPVHVVLDGSHELVERRGVTVAGPLDQTCERVRRRRLGHSGQSTSICAWRAVSSWSTVSTSRSNSSSGLSKSLPPRVWTPANGSL
jgi:hypothetical protein